RMQWFAHAKLGTPTLECRPTLYAQTRAPSAMELAI
ncbi:unnamed protein product, partial [Rotaria magnacalcarata]